MKNKNIIDIAFYSEWDDIRPWKNLLRKKGFNLLCWPKEIKNSSKIEIALVWDPPKNMLNKFPNLYCDISGLSLLHKSSSLKHLIKNPHYFEKLCYGSDFPLYYTPAASPLYFLGLIPFAKIFQLENIENNFLRDIFTLMTLSIPDKLFGRGYEAISRMQ